MSTFRDFFLARPVLTAVLTFLAVYPLLSAAVVSSGAVVSALRRRGSHWYIRESGSLERAHERYPVISILIPAHNEESVVALAVKRALAIRWPELDVIVIDDASTDDTRSAVSEFVEAGLIRVLHKPVNEGKSMALNDATRICRGELLLVLDADGQTDPAVFEWMVPRFVDAPRVAAVTGNAAMAAAGRHGTARRLYRIYVSRMTELEVEPAPFPTPTSAHSGTERHAVGDA